MMTRKHYNAIAAMFRAKLQGTAQDNSAPWQYQEGRRSGLVAAAVELANIFARDNSAFDRWRFLKACGIELED